MLELRRLWTVLFGAWGGAFLAGAVLVWLLGLHGTGVRVALVVAAIIGGAASISEAREVVAMSASERRDAILGWGGLIGAVAAVACVVVLPVAWGLLSAAVVVGVTALLLRRLPAAG